MSDAVSAAAPAVASEPARGRKRAPAGLFAAAALSALLVLLPLAFTVWRAASFGFAEAAEQFQRASELAPSDAAAHYRLARDFDRIGKHEAAQAEREKHAQLIKTQEPIR